MLNPGFSFPDHMLYRKLLRFGNRISKLWTDLQNRICNLDIDLCVDPLYFPPYIMDNIIGYKGADAVLIPYYQTVWGIRAEDYDFNFSIESHIIKILEKHYFDYQLSSTLLPKHVKPEPLPGHYKVEIEIVLKGPKKEEPPEVVEYPFDKEEIQRYLQYLVNTAATGGGLQGEDPDRVRKDYELNRTLYDAFEPGGILGDSEGEDVFGDMFS